MRKVAIIVERYNRFGSEILSAIGKYVYDHPHWVTDHLDFVMETLPPPWLESWRGDGIIVRDKMGECFPYAVKTGAKVVDLSIYRFPGRPTVNMDEFQNVKLCIDCFRERFLSNFAFVGISGLYFSEVRAKVFRQLAGPSQFLFEFHSGGLVTKASRSETRRLKDWLASLPRPVGVIGVYDPIGLQILEICEELQIRVPEEISVVGINNDEAFCRLAKPPLSSVTLDGFRIGYEACKLLESLMNGEPAPEKPLEIPPLDLAVRRSTDTIALEDPQLVRAVRFLRQNAALNIGVKEIADYAGMHRRTLERRFAELLHCTPLEELQRVRLQIACNLLKHSELSVKQAAQKAGFESIPNFYALFQREKGMTPGEFRK